MGFVLYLLLKYVLKWITQTWSSLCLADDHQNLIWDIQPMPRATEDPILACTAEGELNNVQWSATQPDWIAICYNCLEILRVWGAETDSVTHIFVFMDKELLGYACVNM